MIPMEVGSLVGGVNEDGIVELEQVISFDIIPADEDSFLGILWQSSELTWKQVKLGSFEQS